MQRIGQQAIISSSCKATAADNGSSPMHCSSGLWVPARSVANDGCSGLFLWSTPWLLKQRDVSPRAEQQRACKLGGNNAALRRERHGAVRRPLGIAFLLCVAWLTQLQQPRHHWRYLRTQRTERAHSRRAICARHSSIRRVGRGGTKAAESELYVLLDGDTKKFGGGASAVLHSARRCVARYPGDNRRRFPECSKRAPPTALSRLVFSEICSPVRGNVSRVRDVQIAVACER
jgi:hypothetical protein